jgi:hypothetical protein
MHARILERQKLDISITRETQEIQRFLIHPASKVMCLRIKRKPADNFRQLTRSGLQITLKLRIVCSCTELLMKSTEEPRR